MITMQYIYNDGDLEKITEIENFRKIGEFFTYLGVNFCVLGHKKLEPVCKDYKGGIVTYHTDIFHVFPLLTAEYFDGNDFKTKTFNYDMVKILKGHYNEN